MPCELTPSELAHEHQKALSALIFIACSACESLEDAGLMEDQHPRVRKWWKEHKASDRERAERAEKLLRDQENWDALREKLSPAERLYMGPRPK